MSSLTNIEKLKLERLLQMGGGFVLDFTDRTFFEFVLTSTGKDIKDKRYEALPTFQWVKISVYPTLFVL